MLAARRIIASKGFKRLLQSLIPLQITLLNCFTSTRKHLPRVGAVRAVSGELSRCLSSPVVRPLRLHAVEVLYGHSRIERSAVLLRLEEQEFIQAEALRSADRRIPSH